MARTRSPAKSTPSAVWHPHPQHCAKPSVEPLPATSISLQDAIFPLDGAGARKLYASLVQDQGAKSDGRTTFLAKDEKARRAGPDPRGNFHSTSTPPPAGLVGPLGSSSFFQPTVERILSKIEGRGTGAAHGCLVLGMRTGAPMSPILERVASPTQHMLQNFFKSLLNPKNRAAGPGLSAVGPGAVALRQDRGRRALAGDSLDAGSGTEDAKWHVRSDIAAFCPSPYLRRTLTHVDDGGYYSSDTLDVIAWDDRDILQSTMRDD